MVRRNFLRHACAGASAAVTVLTVVACATAVPAPERTAPTAAVETPATVRNAPAPGQTPPGPAAGGVPQPATLEVKPADSQSAPVARPRIVQGNDKVLAPAPTDRKAARDGQPVSFKFEQAPVREVVHAVLGEMLGYTYVLHQPIAGTVTVSTAAPLPADQALSVLEAVLQANGILMSEDAAGVMHVGPPDALRAVVPAPKRIEQAPLPPGFGTIIVPLKFIGAAEMAEILRPIARPDALLRVDTLRNVLILAGSRNQIDGWLEIVRTFDVDLLKGMSVGVFPLQYASVRDIDAALRAATSGDAAPAAGAAAAAAIPLPRQPLLGALRVIPLERLNSLLVVTPRAAYLDEVKRWIERLDQPSETDAEPRLYVYPVQNGSAQHLANVLNGIFGGGTTTTANGADSGVAPGLRSITGATGGGITGGAITGDTSARLGAATSGVQGTLVPAGGTTGTVTAAQPAPGTRGGAGAVTAVSLAGNVRIVGDDLNNSVIVYAPAPEFRKIEATLRRLDTPSAQVLIEATIAEVTLRDELNYGLQWYFSGGGPRNYSGTGQLNLNPSGPIGPIQPGFSYTLTNSLGQVRAVLNALADRSLIRVISSPSLMVLDNHTASIAVGDQQPIRSSETTTVGGNVTTSIQYKDTGVLLTVTPSVNSGDIITMTINQSVTDVGAIDPATTQRAFLQRQIGSRVAVRSGEALVLGGLIRDNTTGGSSGIPYLSRIPVLGALFGAQSRNVDRTELLVVITPRVLRSSQDTKAIGTEMRERMRGLRTLTEKQRELMPEFLRGPAPQPAQEPSPQGAGAP